MMWLQNNNELTMSKMSCQLCFPYIGVILCLTLVGYIYYVYIVFFCLQMVQIIVLKVTLIFFFHLLLFLFLWAYLMTVFTREKTVPDEFQVPEDYFKETVPREEKQVLIENLVNGLPILTLTLQGKFRICTKCRKMKPDRAHHCSECQRCILKMDHHCPWITNCASFSNYKYFLLTLVYGVFFTLFCLTSLLPYFLRSYRGHIKERKLYFLVIAMILSGIVSFVLLVLLICHIRLVLTNRTSLEFLRPQFLRYYGQTKFPFHLGKIRNLEQVFGGKWQKWLVPVYTTYGNGVEFPLRAELQRRS